MYEELKRIAKVLLPASVLKGNEDVIRKLIARKYKGDRYQCNICNYNLSDWVRLDRGDLLCPACGSLGRSRRLHSILDAMDLGGLRVLHFSPPAGLRKLYRSNQAIEYITTDYAGEFEADYNYDILNIDADDESYDVIICYHVLEHIEDDRIAIAELYRVLADRGLLFVQTPFHDPPTDENPEYNTPALRLLHYGQDDHVRIYNADDLERRLRQTGFDVSKRHYESGGENVNGFKGEEIVLISRKM